MWPRFIDFAFDFSPGSPVFLPPQKPTRQILEYPHCSAMQSSEGQLINAMRQSQMGYRPMALEGEGSNCFSITQLVGQKKQQ